MVPNTISSRKRKSLLAGKAVNSTLYRSDALIHNERMEPLLKLLYENATLKPAQLAAMLNLPEAEVAAKIKGYESDQVILAYRTILNEEKLGMESVRAVIEVKNHAGTRWRIRS